MADLYFSPKFANYLREIGMLEALINALKIFRARENYPFELEQRRIVKQSVFKGLCDYYGKSQKKPSVEKILERTEEIADRLYGKERISTVGEEVVRKYEEAVKKYEKKESENLPIIEK